MNGRTDYAAYHHPDRVAVERDPDDQRDSFIDACNAGMACHRCGVRDAQDRTEALGIPLFRCPHCGNEAFDLVTEPTDDAWLPGFEPPVRA